MRWCFTYSGVDCQLIFNHLEAKKGIKTWRRISPVPHTSIPLVVMARNKNIAMFRYRDYLEVWQLGMTTRTSGKWEFISIAWNIAFIWIIHFSMHGQDILCGIAPSNGFAAVVSLQHNMFDYVGYFFSHCFVLLSSFQTRTGSSFPWKRAPWSSCSWNLRGRRQLFVPPSPKMQTKLSTQTSSTFEYSTWTS